MNDRSKEDVDVELNLVGDLLAVGREAARDVARLGGTEEVELLSQEGLKEEDAQAGAEAAAEGNCGTGLAAGHQGLLLDAEGAEGAPPP